MDGEGLSVGEKRLYRRVLCLLLVGAALLGCGQKGALYLPDHNERQQAGK
jgi:predicted small lipoprotein YifL